MEIVRIGKRYTIVIPKKIREALGLKEGQKLVMRVSNNTIIMEPLPDDPFKVFERILGDFEYTREARREAEEYLLKMVKKHESST